MGGYHPLPFYFLALAAVIMADIDPNISNGTCYYGIGRKAIDSYIPCGNVAFGQFQCCQAGDHCLENSACYNGQYGVTYLAGCTDSLFRDSICPNKGDYSDQQWVGLVRCWISNDTDTISEEWAPCEDKSQPELGKSDPCSCNSDAHTAVITAGTGLPEIASLPVTEGDHISFAAGHQPTQLPIPAASTTLSDSTASTAASTSGTNITSTSASASSSDPKTASGNSATASTSTSHPTDPVHSDDGLSKGAQIGVGVGAAVGALVVAALLAFAVFIYRKRKHKDVPPIEDQIRPYSGDQTQWATYNQKADSPKSDPHADMRSPAWSGHKSELPADESNISTLASTPRQSRQQFQAYNPYRYQPSTEFAAVAEMPDHETSSDGQNLTPTQSYHVRSMSGTDPKVMYHRQMSGEQDWSNGGRFTPREAGEGKVFEMPG